MTEEKINGGCWFKTHLEEDVVKNTTLQDAWSSDFPQEQVDAKRALGYIPEKQQNRPAHLQNKSDRIICKDVIGYGAGAQQLGSLTFDARSCAK